MAGLAPSRLAPSEPQSLQQELSKTFEGMEIADTHEHILDESQRVTQNIDFFRLLGNYAIYDLLLAGLPPESLRLVQNESASDVERWRAMEPYWKVARFTGLNQALRIAIRDIYGVEEVSLATIGKVNEVIRARNKPGLYRYILKDRARIRFYVQNDRSVVPTRADTQFFVIAREFDQFIVIPSPTGEPRERDPSPVHAIHKIEQLTNMSITSLKGLKEALAKNFRQAVDAGMVAVKTLLAYEREILFNEVEEKDAARDFDSLMRGKRVPPKDFHRYLNNRPFRQLEDYMFHELIKLADAHSVPVQIHTGINWGFMSNSRPSHLTNLFFLYPQVKFDLFHIGYPYWEEVAVLAKTFDNVYIDFCWAYVISPVIAYRALQVYLDTVPPNKILAFGGDYRYPELTYAHAKMARHTVAQVLAEKVERHDFTQDEAIQLGQMMLHDSATRLFWPRS